MIDSVEYITINTAKEFVKTFHYSKVFSRINRFSIGGYKNDKLVAVMMLGYGTRPLHTIKKILPELKVNNYIEIVKLCVDDKCPRNTESSFISQCIKLIKKTYPKYKILFSWADGIMGRCGYVYQASNFYYGGYIITEMYVDKDGNHVHPRTFQGISNGEKVGNFKTRAYDVTVGMGFQKYFGTQFKYLYPLCGKIEWKMLQKKLTTNWERGNYPKVSDCKWMKQTAKGKREDCGIPPFSITKYVSKKLDENILNLFFN